MSGGYGKALICAGIVSHVDLRLGEGARPVLEAEIAAGNGRFRGIRHSSAWDADPGMSPACMQRGLEGPAARPDLPQGFCLPRAAEPELDAWLFHPQIGELTDLAPHLPTRKSCWTRAALSASASRAGATKCFRCGRPRSREIAKCDNVVVKLGGLAMCLLGYDFHLPRPRPPSSEELAAAWRPISKNLHEAF